MVINDREDEAEVGNKGPMLRREGSRPAAPVASLHWAVSEVGYGAYSTTPSPHQIPTEGADNVQFRLLQVLNSFARMRKQHELLQGATYDAIRCETVRLHSRHTQIQVTKPAVAQTGRRL